MIKPKPILLALLLILGLTPCLQAERNYARKMNRTGIFQHDRSYKGAEVIYYNSGGATRRGALQAWRNSPSHNALLPRIKRIRIKGNYAVGRDRGGVGIIRRLLGMNAPLFHGGNF